MEIKQKIVYVTTFFEGFHCYPEAPAVVAFLRYPHHHNFKVRLAVSVTDSNREVEFYILKAELDNYIQETLLPMMSENMSMSCEHIAEQIAEKFSVDYKVQSVTVDEGEGNGACITL